MEHTDGNPVAWINEEVTEIIYDRSIGNFVEIDIVADYLGNELVSIILMTLGKLMLLNKNIIDLEFHYRKI